MIVDEHSHLQGGYFVWFAEHGAVISVLKKTEDEDALIIRLYNPSETVTIETDSAKFTKPVSEWIETRMDESPLETQRQSSQQLGEFSYCQAKTFRARF